MAQRFTLPAADDDFADPLGFLDSRGWLAGGVRGRRVLCLAAGGGKHGPLFAAAGAEVTVVDLSGEMLALDRERARSRGLHLRTVEASMDDLSALPRGGFDVVVHPVSTCYVPNVRKVYREVAGVTAAGGLYVSQHKQPVSMQADASAGPRGYEIVERYYQSGPLPEVAGSLHREAGCDEFLHRWEDLIGGLCQAGFVVEDLVEPFHALADADPGTFAHRSGFVAPYVRIKARRLGPPSGVQGRLHLPDR
jgi:SAM-dependent methyltransferase